MSAFWKNVRQKTNVCKHFEHSQTSVITIIYNCKSIHFDLVCCSILFKIQPCIFVWLLSILHRLYSHHKNLNTMFWPDCKPEGPLFSAESVCLSVCVCVWPALLPVDVNRFWRNLVTRIWSSLATTIMVQIGRRGTAWGLCKNFKKFSEITIRIWKF